MKLKFTANKVNKLEPPTENKNQIFYWDLDTPGLSVRVTQNSNRAYIYQGRVCDKTIRITIGNVNTWELDQARKEARRLQQLCDQGIDPRRHKAEEVQKNEDYADSKQKALITFGQVFNEYVEENKNGWSERHLEDHITLSQRGGEAHRRGHGITKPGVLASLLDTPLVDLNAESLIKWQATESTDRPGRAALAFRIARACINWCAEHEVYSTLISKDVHASKRVRKSVPILKPRKQALQKNQLKDWFLVVGETPNIMHRVFLQVTILTGPRSESLRSLKKSQLDFKWKTISIWDKVEQDYRLIPMTKYVEKLFKSLPQNSDSEYVFWSDRSRSGHIEDIRKNYYDLLEEKGLPRLTIHDLRRSFSNLTEWLEIPTGVVAQIMGHKPSATAERHYKDRPVDLLRLHHQKIEDWILQEANIKN